MSFSSIIKNPWPYSIIGFFIIAISGIATFISFAVRQNMDLVQKDYYHAELKFQEHRESAIRANESGSKISITYDTSIQSIAISFPQDIASRDVTGKINLYRPSDAKLDRLIPLTVGNDGRQLVPAASLPSGLWKVQIEWNKKGQQFYFSQVFVLPAKTS